jgi:hypothetical protein
MQSELDYCTGWKMGVKDTVWENLLHLPAGEHKYLLPASSISRQNRRFEPIGLWKCNQKCYQ